MYSTDTPEQAKLIEKADTLQTQIKKNERRSRNVSNHSELQKLNTETQTLRKKRRAIMVDYYQIEDTK